MILCLDLGNTHLFGGVYQDQALTSTFRFNSRQIFTEDELGVFIRQVLKENQIEPASIKHIALCSVVPQGDSLIRLMTQKYFHGADFFNLQAGVKTGLKIHYENPKEVGADRIANAIAAIRQFPNQHLIIIDLGTATTFCAIRQDKTYLGGSILPGIQLSMESLCQRAAKLPAVSIQKPTNIIGRNTIESIQSGLFFGHQAAIKGICEHINATVFNHEKSTIIGTGGYAHLFESSGLFNHIESDLVLSGLRMAWQLNQGQT